MKRFASCIITSVAWGTMFLTVAGCGSGKNGSPNAGNGAVSATGRYQNFNFTLLSPKRVYAVGETIPLTLTVQNTGTRDVSGGPADGEVTLSTGEPVSTTLAYFNSPPGGFSINDPIEFYPTIYPAGGKTTFSLITFSLIMVQ